MSESNNSKSATATAAAVQSQSLPQPQSQSQSQSLPPSASASNGKTSAQPTLADLGIVPKSVNDSETEAQLRAALVQCTLTNAPCASASWQLHPSTLEAGSASQSVDEEMARLQVLKSYLVLDSERERRFERLTALVSRIFSVPIALVSLVDLGRQWFMSNRGLGDTRETPRNVAFCAHAILSTQDLLVVPDATLDPRFMNNPLVVNEPFIRFYAGAPLISPEGHKLGTLCIIDTKSRPDGLNLTEKQNLREMSAMVMDTMVNRRKERARQTSSKSVEIACTAHDLLTPLSGVQLSLSLLQDDTDLITQMDNHQKELLQTAGNCSDVMSRICHNTIESFRGDVMKKSIEKDKTSIDHGKEGYLIIANLVENLSKVMDPYPKRVPLTITVDGSTPSVVVADDLKIFRAALNFLTNACKHTDVGSVNMKILVKKTKSGMKELLFEVEDTGTGVDVELYSNLFVPFTEDNHEAKDKFGREHTEMTHSGLGLFSVASSISSIGGDYGFKPRPPNSVYAPSSNGHRDNSESVSSSETGHLNPVTGSIFWFSVPLVVPDNHDDIMKAYNRKVERLHSIESLPGSIQNVLGPPINTIHVNVSPAVNEEYNVSDSVEKRENKRTRFENTPDVANTVSTTSVDRFLIDKKSKVVSTVNMTDEEREKMYKKLTSKMLTPEPGCDSSAESASPGITKCQRTRHALVIDDSITIRKSIERALTKMGFAVTQACNGMEGLKQLQMSLFDVVLCDFLMPIMDGLDCVQQYRSWENRHRPWFRQVIIGISAHASKQDAERGADVGMDRFISKPLPLQTIKDLVVSPEVARASKALDEKYMDSVKECAEDEAPMLPPDLQIHAQKTQESSLKRKADDCGSLSSISAVDIPAGGLVCLIAEDSRSVARALVRAVESRGWRASVVDNGEAALRLLKMRNWDAVFLDDQMPMLSGTSCMSCFRQWETQNRVVKQNHMYLVSGNYISDQETSQGKTIFPAGFDGSLGKPINLKHLTNILEKASIKGKEQILTR
uniref:Uncharacterized protein n=1 Tax=Leptocylindrus danicus TaxID=163516 RepID=A0A7S2PT86_9STRA|mmetsp:Transcript_9720/g.14599  ORF Transcript_9720/g.14599 Transcript_9720/m.14599 type:complete len:1013 (+) Transcript_9720:56-3094(+)